MENFSTKNMNLSLKLFHILLSVLIEKIESMPLPSANSRVCLTATLSKVNHFIATYNKAKKKSDYKIIFKSWSISNDSFRNFAKEVPFFFY